MAQLAATADPRAMADMVRFLVARIEDDENHLRDLAHRYRPHADGVGDADGAVATAKGGRPDPYDVRHLIDECRTRRQLIKAMQELIVFRDLPSEEPVRGIAIAMLQIMIRPYRGHVSFRSDWSAMPCVAHASGALTAPVTDSVVPVSDSAAPSGDRLGAHRTEAPHLPANAT